MSPATVDRPVTAIPPAPHPRSTTATAKVRGVRETETKDLAVETLRGLAVVLMVLGHVIGDTSASGLRVADDSSLRHWYFTMQYLRMPLFAAISGFIYALRPATFAQAGPFLRRKGERLLLPLLSVGTLQYLLHAAVPGTNTSPPLRDVWRLYVFGFDQFWFLQAIFLTFLTIVLLDGGGLMTRRRDWATCLTVTVAASLALPKTPWFGCDGWLYLLPYFVLGCGIRRFADALFRPCAVVVAAAIFATGLVAQQMAWAGWLRFEDERINWVSASVGLAGTLLLFRFRRPVGWLAWCGGSSFAIYLFHVWPIAGSRILLRRSGVADQSILLVAGLVLGVLVPIAIERLVMRHRPLRRILLGSR